MYCVKLSLSLTHIHILFVSLSLSLWAPLPSPLCRTPEQQPYAIRNEEPTAAMLINIDLVSTSPSGSVGNSRYSISTPTANTAHVNIDEAAAAKLARSPFARVQKEHEAVRQASGTRGVVTENI